MAQTQTQTTKPQTQTMDAIMAEIEKLKAENEKLKAAKYRLTLKMGEKGTVSVYGTGRYPVSLYPEQWEAVLRMEGEIRAFIKANKGELEERGMKGAEVEDFRWWIAGKDWRSACGNSLEMG